jgi:hypothetical protein
VDWRWDIARVVERQLCKCKVLSSIPVPTAKNLSKTFCVGIYWDAWGFFFIVRLTDYIEFYLARVGFYSHSTLGCSSSSAPPPWIPIPVSLPIHHPSHIDPIRCFGQDLLWLGQWNITKVTKQRFEKHLCTRLAVLLLTGKPCVTGEGWGDLTQMWLSWQPAPRPDMWGRPCHQMAVTAQGLRWDQQTVQVCLPALPTTESQAQRTGVFRQFLCALLVSDNWYRECRTIQFVCNF